MITEGNKFESQWANAAWPLPSQLTDGVWVLQPIPEHEHPNGKEPVPSTPGRALPTIGPGKTTGPIIPSHEPTEGAQVYKVGLQRDLWLQGRHTWKEQNVPYAKSESYTTTK